MGSILSKPVLDLQGKRQKAEHNGNKAKKKGVFIPSMMKSVIRACFTSSWVVAVTIGGMNRS